MAKYPCALGHYSQRSLFMTSVYKIKEDALWALYYLSDNNDNFRKRNRGPDLIFPIMNVCTQLEADVNSQLMVCNICVHRTLLEYILSAYCDLNDVAIQCIKITRVTKSQLHCTML